MSAPSKDELDVAAQRAAQAIADRLRSHVPGLSEAQKDRRDVAIRWIEHGKRPQPYNDLVQNLWLCFQMRPSEWTSLVYHHADETFRLADAFSDHVILLIRPYWHRSTVAELRQLRATKDKPVAALGALHSAAAFAAAIEALPLGKDIRNRLRALLDQHVCDLKQLSEELGA